MNPPLEVAVFCESCQLGTGESEMKPFEMTIYGSLFFNPRLLSQAQGYKCPSCDREVTVVITPPQNREV